MSGGSFTHIGVHVADSWRAECSTYPDRLPILTIRAGSVTVDVSVRGQCADENAVRFARQLAGQASLFAAEVERLHPAQQAGTTGTGAKCAECGGAVGSAAA